MGFTLNFELHLTIINPMLSSLLPEFRSELANILSYWKKNTPDDNQGGFVGQIDETEQTNFFADKGAVLNARILWSFSAAYQLTSDEQDLEMAHRAFDYIDVHFIDKDFGGVFWTVDFTGRARDKKKQVYAIAFSIYALAAYYQVSKKEQALNLAKSLYADIEKYSYDDLHEGYYEAFAQDWTELADLRLSDKDANEKKTMNTHLHILEAYTLLFKVWPDGQLKKQITKLLSVFKTHILDKNYHLKLFFDEHWVAKSPVISYGHDIEASWLLLEAATVLADETLIADFKNLALLITEAAIEGIDEQGMIYELDPRSNHKDTHKHWWVQAEALVGLMNAYQISKEQKYLNHFNQIWFYIKESIVDQVNGEWFWGRTFDGTLMFGEDKVGLWKCPYHNSRACIELIHRSKQLGAHMEDYS